MFRIKMIAKLSYDTAKLCTKEKYIELLAKNNDSKNWSKNQKTAIIINNDVFENKKSINISKIEKTNINSLLLNNNLRNSDGILHNLNITIYAKDENNLSNATAEYIYNTFLVENLLTNDVFKNVKIENASCKIESITKIDCLKELKSNCIMPLSIEKIIDSDGLGSDLSVIEQFTKIEIDSECATEEEFLKKYENELETSIELKNEVIRIFNTKNNSGINYASYYFKNRNVYNKNIKILVEALYVAKRINKNEYYEVDLNLNMFSSKNKIQLFKKILSLTNGLFIHFRINYNDYNHKILMNCQNDEILVGDPFKTIINEIQKIQHTTICSFHIDLEPCSDKDFLENIINKKFKVETFFNDLTLKQAETYAKSQLEKIGLTTLESNVNKIIEDEYEKNKNGLSKEDVDDKLFDALKKEAYRKYEKYYITEPFDIENEIGLEEIKKELNRIRNLYKLYNETNNLNISQTKKAIFNKCYRFVGESGVGKTYAATLLSKDLYNMGITNSNSIIKSYSIKDLLENYTMLVNGYKDDDVNQFLDENTNDVLIVESIKDTSSDELNEFLSKLNKLKEHNLVILCGTEKDFNKLDNMVPTFKSKFHITINFDMYTTNELIRIFIQKLKDKNYNISESAVNIATQQFEKVRKIPNFSYGNFVENYTECVINNSLDRLFYNGVSIRDSAYYITESDVEKVDMDELFGNDYKTIMSYENAMSELDNLIGLSTVKNYIKSYVAKSKIDKLKRSFGFNLNGGYNMHLCFTGNPGTAKTTVARQISKILYTNGIITKPAIVECGLSDLQGEYLGHTSPKVIKKFEEAKGGVLFIDEAYALNNDDVYSKQTIDTIVAQMENNRDDVIVIFAGYKEPMEEFIKSNTGIKGRISRFLDFPNYSLDELMLIFDKMIMDNGYKLEDEESIRIYVRKYLEDKMSKKDFANGRDVRLLIENTVLNQSMRLFNENMLNNIDKNEVMTLRLEDFVDESDEFYKEKNKIGFIA